MLRASPVVGPRSSVLILEMGPIRLKIGDYIALVGFGLFSFWIAIFITAPHEGAENSALRVSR